MFENLVGREVEGIETIQEILWHKQPEVYVALKNMIHKQQVKIIKE